MSEHRTPLVHPLLPCLLALVLGGVAACSGSKKPIAYGIEAEFIEIYPLAAKACDASIAGAVAGKPVTVHYPASLGADTARRFLEGLETLQQEREWDYRIFREGLKAHLGEPYFSRIQDQAYLHGEQVQGSWFVLVGEEPAALMWRGPADSMFHYLPTKAGGSYTEEELRVRSTVGAEVHEYTHWILWNLLKSKRGKLPIWFEEGTAEFVSMQYQRWRSQTWDSGKELMARLAWQRPAVRAQLFRWIDPSDGRIARYRSDHEAEWRKDLLYSGSTGLVFALEGRLGSGGLGDLYREILEASPETDAALIAIIEKKLGAPIDRIGLPPPEARARMLEHFLEGAETACARREPAPDGVPLASLGHFPEWSDRVLPVLSRLASCSDPAVVQQAVEGLMILGRPGPVAESLTSLATPSRASARTALESSGSLRVVEEFARAGAQADHWFREELALRP